MEQAAATGVQADNQEHIFEAHLQAMVAHSMDQGDIEVYRQPSSRPTNPNKFTKTLRPWFNTECKMAQQTM